MMIIFLFPLSSRSPDRKTTFSLIMLNIEWYKFYDFEPFFWCILLLGIVGCVHKLFVYRLRLGLKFVFCYFSKIIFIRYFSNIFDRYFSNIFDRYFSNFPWPLFYKYFLVVARCCIFISQYFNFYPRKMCDLP
jgi:hypothetical protein